MPKAHTPSPMLPGWFGDSTQQAVSSGMSSGAIAQLAWDRVGANRHREEGRCWRMRADRAMGAGGAVVKHIRCARPARRSRCFRSSSTDEMMTE